MDVIPMYKHSDDCSAKLSVIVPAYNAGTTLRRCLDSLLSQPSSNLEVVVVNDGSTDDTESILQEYAGGSGRLNIVNCSNGGPSRARNIGMSVCSGDFITFCDADDWFDFDSFRLALRLVGKTDADVAVFGYKNVRNGSIKTHRFLTPRMMSSDKFLSALFLDQRVGGFGWNKVYRASIILPHCFDESICVCEDLKLNVEIAISNPSLRVLCLPYAPYNYDLRGASITRGDSVYEKMRNLTTSLRGFGVPETVIDSCLYDLAVKRRASGLSDWAKDDDNFTRIFFLGPAPVNDKLKTAVRLASCKVGKR